MGYLGSRGSVRTIRGDAGVLGLANLLQVFSTACGTPHHLDCWQYAGECSTYGCQERRTVSGNRR